MTGWWGSLLGVVARCRRDRAGNVALAFALGAPILAVAVIAGVETASLSSERALMQQAADVAALAAARDQEVAGRGESRDLRAYVRHVALGQLGDYPRHARVTFTAQSEAGGRIRVEGTATRPALFGSEAQKGGTTIHVRAVAESASQVPICVVSLAPTGSRRFVMKDTSRISATGCLVHSNRSIDLEGAPHLAADVIQASGTVTGEGFQVTPNTGALQLRNPFSVLPMPSHDICTGEAGTLTFRTGRHSLPAGVHCDHIVVRDTAEMVLEPGEHVFRGRLGVSRTATLRGDDVVLFFMATGSNSGFYNNARVDLSGRRSGLYAGFLMVVGRGISRGIEIESPNVNRLLGTIYTSHGWVSVSSNGAVAEDSDWSVIIANRLVLKQSPNLVINTRYEGSPVPVPGGVGNSLPAQLRLIE